MARLFITNAFSLNMISNDLLDYDLLTERVDADKISEVIEINSKNTKRTVSCHFNSLAITNAAKIYSGGAINMVGNGEAISAVAGDAILVFQYNGPRLDADLTEIPRGGNMRVQLILVEAPFYE